MLVGLGQEAAGAAAGVIDGFADLGVNHLDHGPDDHPGGEELAAVVSLLPHFQQQPLIDLGEGENVGGVYLFVI